MSVNVVLMNLHEFYFRLEEFKWVLRILAESKCNRNESQHGLCALSKRGTIPGKDATILTSPNWVFGSIYRMLVTFIKLSMHNRQRVLIVSGWILLSHSCLYRPRRNTEVTANIQNLISLMVEAWCKFSRKANDGEYASEEAGITSKEKPLSSLKAE